MAVYKVPPGTPTGIVGADIVWANGGEVYVVSVEPGPDGKKWSTTGLLAALIAQAAQYQRELKELYDDALGG